MRSTSALPTLIAALAGLLALMPTLRMGFTRDDWLLLWSRLDPSTAPAGAAGVFSRPVAEAWWSLAVRIGADAAWAAHLLQFCCGAFLLVTLWRLARRLGANAQAAAWFVGIVGLHTALLELRLWAAASNGLLALLFGCAALEFWLASRRWLALGLFLLAVGSRADAIVLLPLLLALSAWRDGVAARRSVLVAIGLASLFVLVLSLRAASHGIAWRPEDAGRALRLLILPWGQPLPRAAQATLGLGASAILLAALSWRRVSAHHKWIAASILAVAWAGSLMPWNMAGRYLAFAVLGLGLAALFDPPRRRSTQLLVLGWLAAHAISDIAGNTTRDLLQRSRAETELYRIVRGVAHDVKSVSLVDAPPMGWRDEEADAENVVSVARRKIVAVRFSPGAETSETDELRLEYREGSWRVFGLRDSPAARP